MVEIPDAPEDKAPGEDGKSSPAPGVKQEAEVPITQKASKAVADTVTFLREKTSAIIGKVRSSQPSANGVKTKDGDHTAKGVRVSVGKPAKDGDENTITVELPDSEADEVMTVVPQVSSVEKPPLTAEQIAAKQHHTRLVLSKTADIALLVGLIIVGLLILFPIFFAVVQSLKSTAELGQTPQTFFPRTVTTVSFGELFTSAGKIGVPFYRFVFNTVFVCVVVTALRIAVTLPAAYVLAKVRAPMIRTLNRLVEISLVLSPALAFVMDHVLIAKTVLADTYFAMILPFITSPLCLILIREAVRRIPDDVVSSARLEGASHLIILNKLVVPQIKPAIAATTVLSLLETGRIPKGVLTFSEPLDTLPAFMEQLCERGAAGEMYALAVLMLIPAVILLVVFRKSILKTMTTAALKDEG